MTGPTRIITKLAVGWMVAAGLAGAQDPSPQGEVGAPLAESSPVPSGVLALADGRKVEGTVVIRDGRIAVAAGEGALVTAGLDDLTSLQVRLPDRDGSQSDSETLLAGALPTPWRSKDLGRPTVSGKARWMNDEFILSTSREAEDERFSAMHLAYRPVKGDSEIVARVVRIGNEDEDSFGGIIMTDGLTPENRKAMLAVHFHGEGRVDFRRWGFQGGSSTGKKDPVIKAPFWLKLVREGYDVKAYYSPDGLRWRFLKEDFGKMRDTQIYIGLVARSGQTGRLSEVVIDNVSVNGVGSKPSDPMLPQVVLRSGSRLAADLVKADATAFHFRGRWKDLAITAPQVARVEFFHPLPEQLAQMVQGERPGLLLRSGDFSEGAFRSLRDGTIVMGSVLFGESEFSVLDQADALVLRKVVEPTDPALFRLETQAGSILLGQKASLRGDRLVLEVLGVGELRFGVEEVAGLEKVAPR